MALFGKIPPKPDGTEGYASITLTLKEPDCEIKTIACFIKNDELLQELQRKNQRNLYVRTHKETKFFLYFYCSEPDLSNRLYETKIVAYRFTTATDKVFTIENKEGTRPFSVRGNHVFLPACHKKIINNFNLFLKDHSKAVTLIENLLVGNYRGVQNIKAPVKYLNFSLSMSQNKKLNIPNPSYNVFQNLVDGPLLLFTEASWSLVGWYKTTTEKNRIIVYNLIAQGTTDIRKTSILSNQTGGSQPPPNPSGSTGPPTTTDLANPPGLPASTNSQGASTNLVLEAATGGMTIRCMITVSGYDGDVAPRLLKQFKGGTSHLLANLQDVICPRDSDSDSDSDIIVDNISLGSIIIHLRVKTIEALEELWERYKNGDLRNALERFLITDEIRKLGKTIEMVVTMSEEQYLNARSLLGKQTQHQEKGNPVGEDEPIKELEDESKRKKRAPGSLKKKSEKMNL